MMKTIEQLVSYVGWMLIILLSIYFFADNVLAYFYGYRSEGFNISPIWTSAHMIGGTLSLLLGPFQFWKWLRLRQVAVHRLLGKVYIIGTLLAGLSALRLSLISYCVSCRISLFILAVLVLFTTAAAWWCIKNKNVEAHRQFMVRSYICVLAFVLVRVDSILPLSFMFGTIEDPLFSRTVQEYFFSFVPLIIGEIFLTWIPALKLTRQRALKRR